MIDFGGLGKKILMLALLPGLLGCFLKAGPLAASPLEYFGFPRYLVQNADNSDSSISLDEAVSRIRERTNGRILAADTLQVEGRRIHRIKVLTERGRVRRLQVDAASGRRVGPRR